MFNISETCWFQISKDRNLIFLDSCLISWLLVFLSDILHHVLRTHVLVALTWVISLSRVRLVHGVTRVLITISDPVYADELLAHAQQLFEFAEKYPGKYSQSITDANGYYRFEFILLQVDLWIWSKFSINPVSLFSELLCTVYYAYFQKSLR